MYNQRWQDWRGGGYGDGHCFSLSRRLTAPVVVKKPDNTIIYVNDIVVVVEVMKIMGLAVVNEHGVVEVGVKESGVSVDIGERTGSAGIKSGKRRACQGEMCNFPVAQMQLGETPFRLSVFEGCQFGAQCNRWKPSEQWQRVKRTVKHFMLTLMWMWMVVTCMSVVSASKMKKTLFDRVMQFAKTVLEFLVQLKWAWIFI